MKNAAFWGVNPVVVITEVSEESNTSIIRVKIISKLRTLAVTSNWYYFSYLADYFTSEGGNTFL
jgi:hypothetical protein